MITETVVLLFLLGSVVDASTQSLGVKPTVQVRVEFSGVHPYGRGFTPEQRTSIEESTAKHLAHSLNSTLRYINFDSMRGASLLLFRFDDFMPVDTPNAMREVGFWVSVDEQINRKPPYQVFIKYRDATDYSKILPRTPKAMSSAFCVLLDNFIMTNESQVVMVLSRTVSVADTAKKLTAPQWALPFTYEDLEIENESEFRILAEGTYEQRNRPYNLYATANGKYVPGRDEDQAWARRVVVDTRRTDPVDPSLLQPEKFKVLVPRRVYVTLYMHPRFGPLH